VAALKKFPEFNASLDGEQLVFKNYFHIGFAADTPNGLVVPVIKDADQQGHPADRQEMSELAKKARDGKLGPADMSGGALQHQLAGRHRRALLHAHHQRARGGHPGRVQAASTEPRVGRQAVRAAPDPAAVAELGPPRHRRRGRGPLQRLLRADPGRTSAG
jgi:pyruvate dehydrogenase E2 component (dihydrolipoamide acetyltransferase)